MITFQHQRPPQFSAAVRSAPSPQHGAHLNIGAGAIRQSSAAPREGRSFSPQAPERG